MDQYGRFRGDFGGNTSNCYGGASANHASSASYTGGGTNVNSSGSVNMGEGTSTVNPSCGGIHTGSQLPTGGSSPADRPTPIQAATVPI